MKIIELGVVERDLGMASLVVDLHGLDVRGGDLAQWALQLGVAALLLPAAISEAGLAAAAVGGGGVDFGGNLLGSVLLGLGFSSHDGESRILNPPDSRWILIWGRLSS